MLLIINFFIILKNIFLFQKHIVNNELKKIMKCIEILLIMSI
jgi:hypothetical protein